MLKHLEKIVDSLKEILSKDAVLDAAGGPVAMVEQKSEPEITFDDMKVNLLKRTYCFDYYKAKLMHSDPRLLHWIGSINHCGYQREKSLKYLINNYKPGDENRILLRLEDWVPQISNIAKSWVLANFNNLSLMEIGDQHRLILYLIRKDRLAGSTVLSFVEGVLMNRALEANDEDFYLLNTMLRRRIYDLSIVRSDRLRKRVLFDRDPFNRLLLIRDGFERLTSNEIDCLKNDKSVLVKKRFLSMQISSNQKPCKDDLIVFSLDKNIFVREFARFYLNEFYSLDAYSLYEMQTDSKYFYIADYAKKEDIAVLLEGVNDSDRYVKYLCLKAVCKIDYSQLKTLNILDLLNSNKKIRKLVCNYLPKIFSLIELAEYKEVIIKASNGHEIYLFMLFEVSIWTFINESLSYIVENPDTNLIKFILNLYYQKPYIYEKLCPDLKKVIINNALVLETNPNYQLQEFIKHLMFTIKSA
ncbi:MAG: hypothetical protein HRU38_19925 [Saccharospirillaceae bacterium]|nr:hypothetical protein [Pseudomonadales bacterium]NRB80902.1 hypothetical protein [Saccharospirillaceae bacterium]